MGKFPADNLKTNKLNNPLPWGVLKAIECWGLALQQAETPKGLALRPDTVLHVEAQAEGSHQASLRPEAWASRLARVIGIEPGSRRTGSRTACSTRRA